MRLLHIGGIFKSAQVETPSLRAFRGQNVACIHSGQENLSIKGIKCNLNLEPHVRSLLASGLPHKQAYTLGLLTQALTAQIFSEAIKECSKRNECKSRLNSLVEAIKKLRKEAESIKSNDVARVQEEIEKSREELLKIKLEIKEQIANSRKNVTLDINLDTKRRESELDKERELIETTTNNFEKEIDAIAKRMDTVKYNIKIYVLAVPGVIICSYIIYRYIAILA